MRRLFWLIPATLVWTCLCATCPADSITDKLVSAELQKMSLGDALLKVAGDADLELNIDDKAADLMIPATTLKDVRLELAIKSVCRAAGAKLVVDGRKFSISEASSSDSVTATEAQPQGSGPAEIRVGMSRSEVQQINGKPDTAEFNQATGEEVWHYGSQKLVFRTSKLAEIGSSSGQRVNLGVQTGNHYTPAPTPVPVPVVVVNTSHAGSSHQHRDSTRHSYHRPHSTTGNYVYVKGHYTKSGKYVSPHWQRY